MTKAMQDNFRVARDLDTVAGILDRTPIARARALAEAVADAERAWGALVLQRDAALRDAVAANPDCDHRALGREVGLAGVEVTAIVRWTRAA